MSWMIDFDVTRPEMRRRMILRRLALVLDFALTVFALYIIGGFVADRIDPLDTFVPVVLDPPSWLGSAVVVVLATLQFGSLLFAVLPAQRRAMERNPSAAFTGEQRRQVWRKIRDGVPVPAGEIPLLRAVAGAAHAYRWVAVFLFGFVVQTSWVALTSARPAPWVLFAAAWLLSIVLLLRRARHGKAFLQRTAAHV